MANREYSLQASVREVRGKGASRRLRRENGVPAVIYGADQEAQSITLKHNELYRNLAEEAFYSQIISVDFGDHQELAILRDLQRHPFKQQILHADLQRIKEGEAIQMSVPLRFVNAQRSPAIKTQGGKINRIMSDVEISCLPKDLPQYIEVDLSKVEKGQIIHLSDLVVPEGVTLTQLALGEDHDQALLAVN